MPIEQARCAEDQRAGADAEQKFGVAIHAMHPFEHCRIVHLSPSAKTAGNEHDIGGRRIAARECVRRIDAQTMPREHRPRGFSNRMHLEGRVPGAPSADREDFERATEIEYFDVVEDDDGYVSHVLRRRRGLGERH